MALTLGRVLERASSDRIPVLVGVEMLKFKIFDKNSVLK